MTSPVVTLSRNGRKLQIAAGLTLAGLIVTGWVTLHAYAMFVFEFSWASLPVAALIAAVQCWLSVGLFIVSHDAMHGSLAPGWARLNGAIGAALLFLYAGFGWRKMRDAHFEHHKYPGTAKDPDFDTANPRGFGAWYLTFLRRYFGWQSFAYVMTVVLVYWLALGVPTANVVLLYGVPAIASSVQLFYFGTFRPHRHAQDEFADRHNARSEDFGPLASLASCFHFGYHREHHMRPELPWWALPRARRETLAAPAASGKVQA